MNYASYAQLIEGKGTITLDLNQSVQELKDQLDLAILSRSHSDDKRRTKILIQFCKDVCEELRLGADCVNWTDKNYLALVRLALAISSLESPNLKFNETAFVILYKYIAGILAQLNLIEDYIAPITSISQSTVMFAI